jgi:hypothetical protein
MFTVSLAADPERTVGCSVAKCPRSGNDALRDYQPTLERVLCPPGRSLLVRPRDAKHGRLVVRRPRSATDGKAGRTEAGTRWPAFPQAEWRGVGRGEARDGLRSDGAASG